MDSKLSAQAGLAAEAEGYMRQAESQYADKNYVQAKKYYLLAKDVYAELENDSKVSEITRKLELIEMGISEEEQAAGRRRKPRKRRRKQSSRPPVSPPSRRRQKHPSRRRWIKRGNAMDESVFGAGFDLQDYIHKRSLDIQDLRERALYRQVTDTLMVNLFQYLGDEQKKLEQRILSEIQSRESEFTIHIGVTGAGPLRCERPLSDPDLPGGCGARPAHPVRLPGPERASPG